MTEHQAPWPDGEVLAGIVERVTFHNAESGFAVLSQHRYWQSGDGRAIREW